MKPKELAIVGFGNQAKAWALNLADSGFNIQIFSRSITEEQQNETKPLKIEQLRIEKLKEYKSIALLIPDDQHFSFLKKFAMELQDKTRIIYAHGYSCTAFPIIEQFPNLDHLLLAPKSIATELRKQYLEQGRLTAAVAIGSNPEREKENKEFLEELARALGINWGPHWSTFKEECYADLFSEQTSLCHLIPMITEKSFNFLVKKGITPEVAFAETFLELKLIVDTMIDIGPQKLFEKISPNALIGAELTKQKWEEKIPWQELFENCWSNIKSKNFFTEINKSDLGQIRQNTTQFWEKNILQIQYNKMKHDEKNNDDWNLKKKKTTSSSNADLL